MIIQEALLIIIEEAKKSKPDSALQYAATYANGARTMKPGSEAWRTQMLYIKSNTVYWRGEVATLVRAAINQELSK